MREHGKREHHILLHVKRIEQRASLEYHSYFLPERFALFEAERRKISSVKNYFTAVHFHQTNHTFHQNCFPRTTSANDEISFPFFKSGGNIFNDLLAVEIF